MSVPFAICSIERSCYVEDAAVFSEIAELSANLLEGMIGGLDQK